MPDIVLNVQMKCEACVKSVRETLQRLEGVDSVDVSLEKQQAVVRGTVSEAAAAESVAEWACVSGNP